MKTIEIYSCGMDVKVGGEIDAKIAEVIIGERDQIQYRVVWVRDGSRESSWVNAFEVEPSGKEYRTMLKVMNYT